jgi:hypothetical protein
MGHGAGKEYSTRQVIRLFKQQKGGLSCGINIE